MASRGNVRKPPILSFEEDEGDGDDGVLAAAPMVSSVQTSSRPSSRRERSGRPSSSLAHPAAPAGPSAAEDPGASSIAAALDRKARLSHRPGLRISHASAPCVRPGSAAPLPSVGGEYSAERMAELRRNTRAAAPSSAQKGPLEDGAEAGTELPVFYDADGPIYGGAGPVAAAATSIPDSGVIKKARELRERLRKGAASVPDVLPVPGGLAPVVGAAARRGVGGVGGSSSEEDMEDAGDVRVAFGRGRGAQDEMGIAEESRAGSSEEEEQTWAAEQLSKALGSRHSRFGAPRAATEASESDAAASLPVLPLPSEAEAQLWTRASAARERLLKAQEQARQRAEACRAHSERLQAQRASLEADLGQLQEHAPLRAERYGWLQRLRAWVGDLCAMLADKSAFLEELEDTLQGLAASRARRERWALSLACLAERLVAEAEVSAALGALSRGGAEDAREEARAAGDRALARLAGGETDLVREQALRSSGGREGEEDPPGDEASEAVEAVRAALRALQIAEDLNMNENVSGGAWCAHSPLASAALQSMRSADLLYFERRSQVLTVAASAFADVDAEFASLGAVAGRLEDWKRRDEASYRQAFVPEAVPALVAPWARLELLAWSPLERGLSRGEGSARDVSLEAHDWYHALFAYGMGAAGEGGSGGDEASPWAALQHGRFKSIPGEKDLDDELVPVLVERLVMPLVLRWVGGGEREPGQQQDQERARRATPLFDPGSAFQARALATILGDLAVHTDALSPARRALEAAALAALENLDAAGGPSSGRAMRPPPWPRAVLAVCPRAAAFARSCARRAAESLEALACLEGVLERGPLLTMATKRLAAPGLVPSLADADQDPAVAGDRLATLLLALPREWGGAPELRGLAEAARQLAQALEAARLRGTGTALEESAARLADGLERLGLAEEAQKLARIWGVG